MKTGTILAIAVAALIAIAGVYMIDIDQTEEATLPEVTVEGGNMPEFDAEVGEVEITEETITVPGIEITAPEEDVASN
ncbi:hypothetical protein K3728_14455 [Rhodobacteraceae bacterium M385]|nr:hypothetical protein K3728_14455 [Rhodobacteraceae bacterium M385]